MEKTFAECSFYSGSAALIFVEKKQIRKFKPCRGEIFDICLTDSRVRTILNILPDTNAYKYFNI
jgi:hypothetical protein